MQRKTILVLALGGALSVAVAVPTPADENGAFIPKLVNSSTVPANGDLNPYGVEARARHPRPGAPHPCRRCLRMISTSGLGANARTRAFAVMRRQSL